MPVDAPQQARSTASLCAAIKRYHAFGEIVK
jgi:hypothetical protein